MAAAPGNGSLVVDVDRLDIAEMSHRHQSLAIRPVRSARERAAWLDLPSRVLSHDPHWIAPMRLLERRRFSRKHQPFFTFGDAEMFIAWRSNRAVGRISAQVNRRHLERHQDGAGHFGFFACEDDPQAASALARAAADWIRSRGLGRMIGPFSFSINEEAGLLVEGFGSPPGFLMGHAAPWAGRLLEAAGLAKEIDLLAYRMQPGETPELLVRLAGLAARSGRITVRHFDMSRYRQEISILVEIFNDAWSENWGFVPFSDAEIDALVSETRFLLRGKYGRILSLDGEPVGVILALPDLNDALASRNGRILPFHWLRLLRAFWREDWRAVRIPLLGLRKSVRFSPLAPAMLALLISEILTEARSYPLEWAEFSWVLENNRAMVKLAEIAAGPPAKVYRIYSQDLRPQ